MSARKHLFSLILVCIAFLPSGCGADNADPKEQATGTRATPPHQDLTHQEVDAQHYLARAKRIVRERELTELAMECLQFKTSEQRGEYTALIDAYEIHNAECGGDPHTSVRAFSIAFGKNQRVWSDAKSPLGEMEPL
jgi:hypothetical protein